ncbi:hypothetical protein [Actomonas aquatica]|uniref:Uncharacterized protein n=1 Tax=Actomonas aquatica TaxID=2866162 RepID=A0ABZ1C376_9BACT|nr:hypothetical protein [Opitutus sp. WL0086]WRQ85820.1 hypothetical protein K1X11_013490 [Opitutus sp. WL0086]
MRLLLLALTLTSMPWQALAAEPDPTKPYRLFVGVDLKLKPEDDTQDYRPIDSLKAREVILAEPGRPTVPMREVSAFSWEHKPKVGRAAVTIDDFEQHRAFSLRNDKKLQYMATQNNMAIYQQEKADAARLQASDARFSQEIARGIYVYAENDAASRAGLERGPEPGYTPGGRGGLNFDDPQGIYGDGQIGANLRTANAEAIEANDNMADQLFDTLQRTSDPTMLDRMQGTDGDDGADVLELTFTLSAPYPIAEAYVVVLGAIKQGDDAGVITFHEMVGKIGPQPRKIRIRKTGFKPGFVIEDVKLHLYARGKELGTNLSERAVDMTRDQAREFLLLAHLADHAIESVPATPVWNLAPPSLLGAADASRFDYPVIVTLDADGSVMSIHDSETEARAFLASIHDAAELRTKSNPGRSLASSLRTTDADARLTVDQTGRLPAHVVAAINELIFLPALDVGSPTPGTAAVNLAEFFR